MNAEDRKRFAFVNKVVAAVEERKVLAKDKTAADTVDKVLTNKVAGMIFAAVMYGVFWVSQTALGPLIADWLVGWMRRSG